MRAGRTPQRARGLDETAERVDGTELLRAWSPRMPAAASVAK